MSSITRLLAIMARLRDPQRGCPWDLEQTFAAIAPYTIEEAYEVADAIERDDRPACATSSATCCCRWCSTRRWRGAAARSNSTTWSRDLRQAGAAPSACLRRRAGRGADAQTVAWEEQKGRSAPRSGASVLDGVPLALPALHARNKLGSAPRWSVSSGPTSTARSRSSTRRSASCAGRSPHDAGEARDRQRARRRAVLRRQCLPLPRASIRKRHCGAPTRSSSAASVTSSVRLREQGRSARESTLEEMDKLWDEGKQGESTGNG